MKRDLRTITDTNPGVPRHSSWIDGRFHWVLGLVVMLTAPCGAASFDERLIAAVLMAEARGEGVVGMTAVGEVIANRASKRQMHPAQVVREAYQFSPLNRVKPHELVSRYEKMPLYAEALRIASTVIRAPIPRWARGRKPVAVVGGQRFWLLNN